MKENTANTNTQEPSKKQDYYIQRSEQYHKEKPRRRNDDVLYQGPNYIDKAYYRIEDEHVYWCHIEEPGRFEKLLGLGYSIVRDPITGDALQHTSSVGSRPIVSYAMSCPMALYKEGELAKAEKYRKDYLDQKTEEQERLQRVATGIQKVFDQ